MRDCQQLPSLILSYSHLSCTLPCAYLMPAPARASLASPREAATTLWICIYIILVHKNCLKFAFPLVFTDTSHILFSPFVPTLQHSIISILDKKAQNFKQLLYNEHSKIKATFTCPTNFLTTIPNAEKLEYFLR